MTVEELSKMAYEGTRGMMLAHNPSEECPMPHWDEAPKWMKATISFAVRLAKIDAIDD